MASGFRKQQLDAQASQVAAQREALRIELEQWETLKSNVMRQGAALRKDAKMLNEQRKELEQACIFSASHTPHWSNTGPWPSPTDTTLVPFDTQTQI